HIDEVKHLTIWGNHSATQYPDIFNARINGESAAAVIDDEVWLADDFIPTVAKRGAAIIEARGLSSAASAANAAIDHVNSWVAGTPEGDWTSAAVVSDGSYGVPEGIISSFPCIARDGQWEIVQGLEINDFSRPRIEASVAELVEEREAVRALGLL
ncbi:MAG TPA: malate dehydrogenase, partial [Actinobacteria bacterium]|nr:malate dehydrogenase [Actinomycetota bacterium]